MKPGERAGPPSTAKATETDAVNQPPFALMKDAGFICLPGLGAIEGAHDDDGAAWFFPRLEISLFVDYDGARDRLVLRLDIDDARAGADAQLLAHVLRYNEHAAETELRLGLDRDDGGLVLILDIAPGEETAESLCNIVFNMLRQRAYWRAIIARSGGRDEAVSHPPGHLLKV